MIGYKLFLEEMEKLSLEERKEVVKNIFSLDEVKLYTIDEEDGNIVFRISDGKNYIKITIIFGDVEIKTFLKFRIRSVDICCDVFLQNFIDDGDAFSNFVKILLEGDISYFESFL